MSLLERPIDPDTARSRLFRLHMETALHLADGLGRTDVVRRLVAAGSDHKADSWAALHWAAADGHERIVRCLVEAGADTNKKVLLGGV